MLWTLIYHDLRHHMAKILWTREAQPSESATHFDHVYVAVNKSLHHGKPLSICGGFLPQYLEVKASKPGLRDMLASAP